ncbi:CRISPR-associated protein Cas4 [Anaerovorax odorimutans]|uniref:CRISPR-associated exonuclease Cas4 n=1 Tax=Anaerovorax odorimutans TaxID=109327 RepID=A0ABT1RLI9_9FIRM|nr:CRISPR-associated protein Cas4 [Anaerovorax odorimutans]MCQ4636030.1 CRISPR-associated protein Cas4 [Anaerovorax odorimutans]
MARYEEAEYLQLSGIQHFEFCRRQWALIHIEQQWAENYRTTDGELMHKKAHEEISIEKRGSLLIMRGLRIASASLGVSGQCDVVEFHQKRQGITLSGYDGLWEVLPVEYKRGTKKNGLEDEVQLCAQALCLEEMLLTEIPKGYLFYGENKRREEVVFSAELRSHVAEICRQMHDLYKKGYTPKVRTNKKCRSCSLRDLCLPKLNKNLDVEKYINERIGEAGEGE